MAHTTTSNFNKFCLHVWHIVCLLIVFRLACYAFLVLAHNKQSVGRVRIEANICMYLLHIFIVHSTIFVAERGGIAIAIATT